MRTVITYGTFDIFHIGHLLLLERLRGLGDRLVVGVSTDGFNSIKGKKTVVPYEQRARILSALKCVDKVLPENAWEQKRADILREDVKIFGMGSDWAGKFDSLRDICEVVYLPRTEDISSTELKDLIKKEVKDELYGLKHMIDSLHAEIGRIVS